MRRIEFIPFDCQEEERGAVSILGSVAGNPGMLLMTQR
jgi:hypothetical protein